MKISLNHSQRTGPRQAFFLRRYSSDTTNTFLDTIYGAIPAGQVQLGQVLIGREPTNMFHWDAWLIAYVLLKKQW